MAHLIKDIVRNSRFFIFRGVLIHFMSPILILRVCFFSKFPIFRFRGGFTPPPPHYAVDWTLKALEHLRDIESYYKRLFTSLFVSSQKPCLVTEFRFDMPLFRGRGSFCGFCCSNAKAIIGRSGSGRGKKASEMRRRQFLVKGGSEQRNEFAIPSILLAYFKNKKANRQWHCAKIA